MVCSSTTVEILSTSKGIDGNDVEAISTTVEILSTSKGLECVHSTILQPF